MKTLRQHFAYHSLPEYIFDLVDLPEPSYAIFDQPDETTTTRTQTTDIEADANMDHQ